MFTTKASALTSLSVYLICLMEVNFAFHKFKQITGMKFKQTFVTETAEKSSFMQCAVYCTSSQDCVSFSWKPNQTQCLLSNRDVSHETERGYSLESATGWNTFTMPLYQVFMVPGESVYTMDFTDATNACNERGTRLASPDELLVARNQGFNFCYCGWMNDGRNGFVLQAPSGCWGSYNTGVIICGLNGAGAWCFQN